MANRDYSNILPGYRFSDDFATRFPKPNNLYYYHRGVDLAARAGSAIYAPYDGEVVDVVPASIGGNAGNYLVLKHTLSDGRVVQTRYLHLQEAQNLVKGDTVTAGQQIAKVGNTGTSTGPHLHYEERLVMGGKAIAVDPQHDLFGLSGWALGMHSLSLPTQTIWWHDNGVMIWEFKKDTGDFKKGDIIWMVPNEDSSRTITIQRANGYVEISSLNSDGTVASRSLPQDIVVDNLIDTGEWVLDEAATRRSRQPPFCELFCTFTPAMVWG